MESFADSALLHQNMDREIAVSRRPVGIEFDRASKARLRQRPLPIASIGHAESHCALPANSGSSSIAFSAAARILGSSLVGIVESVAGSVCIRRRQTRVGRRKRGILGDGLLE